MISSVFSHFNTGIVVNEDECHITYKQNSCNGEGTAAVYPVLSGIEIVVLEFQAERYIPSFHKEMNVMEINLCLEGRIECKMRDGCLQYIGEGDLFLNTLHNHSDSIELPLGYYRGIVVMIDIDKTDLGLLKLLPNISINVKELAGRFFMADECFLIPSKEEIRHLFSGMYSISPQARGAYYQLKVFELLLYLDHFEPKAEKQVSTCTRQQVDIVKQIQKQITSDLSRRYTIDELAREYCISPTTLKTHFKTVYGRSIASYVKGQRIWQAEALLRETDQSISDIAKSVGYESQSKFGEAFKERLKTTPMEYRKRIKKHID